MFYSKKAASKEKKRAQIELKNSKWSSVHLANRLQRRRPKRNSRLTGRKQNRAEPSISAPVNFNNVMNDLFVGRKGNAFVDDIGNIKPISYGLIAVQLNAPISPGSL